MDKETYDLTQGDILKKLLMVAFPIMGTQIMQMAYNLTDMFWLGRMQDSVTAVAASGIAGMFMWLGMAVFLVGRLGAEIGVSQNFGKGDRGSALGYAQNSVAIALILGVAYGGILIVFAPQLIFLLQVKEAAVFESACVYLRIVGIGVAFTFVSGAITGSFNGAANSKLTFWANAVGLLVNIVLDPIMILALDWGVVGAAIATVLAQGLVTALFVFFAKRHPERPFLRFRVFAPLDPEKVRQIFRWSTPLVVESAAFTGLAMVVTGMVSAWYGEMAVAVQRVGSQIESLSWLLGGGFSSAVAAFVGQNYGARLWDRIERGFRISLIVLLMWEAIVTAAMLFGGRFFFSLFLKEPPMILDMGGTYLRILGFSQVFMALEGTCSGVFRGMGKTVPPSVCSIVSNVSRPFLSWFFAGWLGLNGLWLGIAVTGSLRGILMAIWYFYFEKRELSRERPEPSRRKKAFA